MLIVINRYHTSHSLSRQLNRPAALVSPTPPTFASFSLLLRFERWCFGSFQFTFKRLLLSFFSALVRCSPHSPFSRNFAVFKSNFNQLICCSRSISFRSLFDPQKPGRHAQAITSTSQSWGLYSVRRRWKWAKCTCNKKPRSVVSSNWANLVWSNSVMYVLKSLLI
jgi:hypothetical protein